jgi:hypothetical protein
MDHLSIDKHCEMLTYHIRDRTSAIMDGFKLYVQMFSALAGGSVLLQLQFGNKIPPNFVTLADALAVLIFLMAVIIILENLRSWFQYRKALSEVAGLNPSIHAPHTQRQPIIPLPNIWKANKMESVMLLVMVCSLIGFCYYNPLQQLTATPLCVSDSSPRSPQKDHAIAQAASRGEPARHYQRGADPRATRFPVHSEAGKRR